MNTKAARFSPEVPAVNCATGRGQFFKTPHHPTFEFDHKMPVTEVALATAAAPAMTSRTLV